MPMITALTFLIMLRFMQGVNLKSLGQILSDVSWDRSTYVVSSKVFWGGKDPESMAWPNHNNAQACGGSL